MATELGYILSIDRQRTALYHSRFEFEMVTGKRMLSQLLIEFGLDV